MPDRFNLRSVRAAALVAAFAVLSCDGGEKAPEANGVSAEARAAAAGQLAEARKLLAAGKGPEAVRAAEALLTAHPEDDAAWDFAELAAIRAGAAGELVDRLSAEAAIGGRADRHHVLRGVLALEANRLGDALTSARALESVAPGDAAAIVAQAVARGAPAPTSTAAAPLLALAPGDPPSAEADALPGWRVAIVRAERRLANGDAAGAAMEVARAQPTGPRGSQLVAAVRIRAAADAHEAWSVAEAAARAAVEAGDSVGAAEILDAVLPAALGSWKSDELAKLATDLRTAVNAAGDSKGAAAIAAIEADAALRAGRPLQAREAATAALASPGGKARASWSLALAEAALGNAAGVASAASSLTDPRAAGARDLARALRGEPVSFPTAGLAWPDSSFQALLGSGWLADPDAALDAASAAAGGSPDLALWASLARTRRPITFGDTPGAALLAENAARTWLGDGATASLPATPHPAAAAWASMIAGDPPPPSGVGVKSWPTARAALAASDFSNAAHLYGTLALAVPAWRTGPWAPLLALDGPMPYEVESDVAMNARSSDPLPVAAVMHGWVHRRNAVRRGWRHGMVPFPPGATAAQRDAVWNAVAAYRAGTLAWVAGEGEYPATELASLEEAERAAGLSRVQSPTLAAIRTALDGDALLSFRYAGSLGTEALYLTETKGRVVMLPASAAGNAGDYIEGLRSGRTEISLGNSLRSTLLDDQMDMLIGIGRYVVVGEPALGMVPIVAMPEQSDGLRYLKDIRNVGYLPDLDSLIAAPVHRDDEYSLTMAGFCPTQLDCEPVQRAYPDTTLYVGPNATLAAWRDNAPRARFIHLGTFPASPDGGFKLQDGVLSLADIAATPMIAVGAAVPGGDGAHVSVARAGALRRGGVAEVFVEGWSSNPAFRERMLLHFWEGLNQRHRASRALTEARTLAMREVGDVVKPPVFWAGYFVSARP